jgi:hypothetical protein
MALGYRSTLLSDAQYCYRLFPRCLGFPRGLPPSVRELNDFELAGDVISERGVGLRLGNWIR